MSADLSHIDTWLFDLDNTLYPPECEVMALMSGRMTAFVARRTGLERDQAYALQMQYLHEHGTTLAGLMAHHGVDPVEFFNEVHDVSLDCLAPDDELDAGLARLPGRRLVFTNADEAHAVRVLDRLGIADRFEAIFHVALSGYVPKPHPDSFSRMVAAHGVDPAAAAFFEDSERNLEPAAALGMTTILVGPHAADCTASFVDHRTHTLPPFLNAALLKEPAR
jgi:putative hydrolase of the HAD superfamily